MVDFESIVLNIATFCLRLETINIFDLIGVCLFSDV